MACVYILQSSRGGKYYIGSTVNLVERLEHHKGGFTPSTRRFGNVELVFSQEYETIEEARNIERRLKKMKRRDYLEKIISNKKIDLRS